MAGKYDQITVTDKPSGAVIQQKYPEPDISIDTAIGYHMLFDAGKFRFYYKYHDYYFRYELKGKTSRFLYVYRRINGRLIKRYVGNLSSPGVFHMHEDFNSRILREACEDILK